MRYLPAILLLFPLQALAGDATVRGTYRLDASFDEVADAFRQHERELLQGLRATVVKRKGDQSLVDVRLRGDETSRILLRTWRHRDGARAWFKAMLMATDGKIAAQWTRVKLWRIEGGTLATVELHASIPSIHNRFIKVSLERSMKRIDEKLRGYL